MWERFLNCPTISLDTSNIGHHDDTRSFSYLPVSAYCMSQVTSAYLPAAKVHALYAVARTTLRDWAESGKVEALRAGGTGKRLYKLADIERVLGVDHGKEKEAKRERVCYARVSSQHQRGDLDRQIAFLRQHYPEHRLYSDIGSGLNFKRAQFVALLDAVHAGIVAEIVVTDKDRLCRFGSDLVQWFLDKAGTKLVVHSDPVERPGNADGEPDYNHELSDDIISIITFFTARSNGQRSARNRKRRRDDITGEETKAHKKTKREAAASKGEEDSNLSDH
jgi:predicted site-specific integrase-resolvase